MAPKANRQPRRAQDPTPNPRPRNLAAFDRVHLPALQDTPSSRRQYSYGAAVEPPAPRRFTGDYSDKPYTLENAIQHALDRQNRELEDERTEPHSAQSPRKSAQPRSTRRTHREADADDELASAAFPPPQRGTSAAPSDADEVRSFGMESDVYGDATIASTPDVAASGANQHPGQRSVNRRDARRRHARASDDPAYKDVGSEESSEDELGVRRSKRRPRKSTSTAQQPPKEAQSQNTVDDAQKASKDLTSEASDAHRATAQSQATPKRQSPRSAPQIAPGQQAQQAQQAQVQAQQAPAQQVEARTRQLRERLAARRAALAEDKPAPTGNTQRRQPARQADEDIRSDHSEQDAAIQGDIQAREAALSQHSGTESERKRWQQRWDYMQALSPSNYLRQRRQPLSEPEDDKDDEDDETVTERAWQKLLSLRTYSDSVRDFLAWMSDNITYSWNSLRLILPSFYTLAAILCGISLFFAAWPALEELKSSQDLFDDGSTLSTFSPLSTIKAISDGIGAYLPVIGHSRVDWDSLLDLSDFDENNKLALDAFLEKYGQEFESLKRSGRLQKISLEKLNAVVPKIVHMELGDNGKPIVSQEFWHALRELIQNDDSILSVRDDVKLSKKNWKLVSSKVLDDPHLDSKLSASTHGSESRMEQKMSQLWDTWMKENESRLQAALGSVYENIPNTGTDKELDARIARVLREQGANSVPSDGVFVTKNEFIQRLSNEFASQRAEIRAELHDIRPQVKEMILDAIEAIGVANQGSSELSDSSRAEIKNLVNSAVSTALANANIEALARGKIHNHWDTTLKNSINFFSMGSGATVNRKRSSATYDPYREGVVDRRKLENGLRGARRWEHHEALAAWSEDGDKWCAASGVNNEGQPHGYMLAVQLGRPVIPQQIVIEHILPGATIDPDARPRDMEVYVQIDDPELRERVLDFSATHVGAAPADEVSAPLDSDMVRVGRFTYAGAELHDGVYVYQLSGELTRLGAATEQVVVRAVNNYGAPDHTCFYRLRLYGDSGEEKVVKSWHDATGERTIWQRMTGW